MCVSCYHPLRAIVSGKTVNGKDNFQFLSDAQLMLFKLRTGHDFPESAIHYLPCGQCIGCRLDYSRQWANRCMLELGYHESSYFLTLTYDDVHVPYSYYGNPDTGEAIPVMTLRKSDFQKFMKRLRFNSGQKVSFFGCGEYGSNTLRPHYHVIIFGLQLDDLTLYKQSAIGYNYYNSDFLSKCWPFGYVVAGQVTWETCAYVARYILKKQKGQTAHVYEDFNLEPEFSLMSLKPAIGKQYYLDHPDMFQYNKINISTPTGGRSFAPPRYYEHMFEIDNPSDYADYKERKKTMAENLNNVKKTLTDKQYYDMLSSEEQVKISRIKSLRRNLI